MSDTIRKLLTTKGTNGLRPHKTLDGRSLLPDGSPSELEAILTLEQLEAADHAVEQGAKYRWPVTRWLLENDSLEVAGLQKSVLEVESISVPKPFPVDMDDAREPLYQLHRLPLPVTHSDWRIHSDPHDQWLWADASGRRVAESVERTVLGTADNKFGIDGIFNRHAAKLRRRATVEDMIAALHERTYYGPYLYVFASSGDADNDKAAVRRAKAKKGVTVAIPTLYLQPGQSALVQCTPDVLRLVIGQPLATVQWDAPGSENPFKTLCIIVPQVRRDARGSCGIAVTEGDAK